MGVLAGWLAFGLLNASPLSRKPKVAPRKTSEFEHSPGL
jgi:hypothetical protein